MIRTSEMLNQYFAWGCFRYFCLGASTASVLPSRSSPRRGPWLRSVYAFAALKLRRTRFALYRRSLLATLEQRDVICAGTALAASRSLPFRATGDGETVQGVFKQIVQLSSGKFALVENAHEFTLVPWRPVIENRLGREVMGVVQGESVSWQLGRNRGLGL
jgi:hypothetical protein